RRRRMRLYRGDEFGQLVAVRLRVAVEKEMQQRIDTDARSIMPLERRRALIAGYQHAVLTERFDPLVVAVSGTKARVDVHERTSRHSEHHHRSIGVSMRIAFMAHERS